MLRPRNVWHYFPDTAQLGQVPLMFSWVFQGPLSDRDFPELWPFLKCLDAVKKLSPHFWRIYLPWKIPKPLHFGKIVSQSLKPIFEIFQELQSSSLLLTPRTSSNDYKWMKQSIANQEYIQLETVHTLQCEQGLTLQGCDHSAFRVYWL